MKRALAFGPSDLRIIDAPPRVPGAGEVSARVLLTTLVAAHVRYYAGPLPKGLAYPTTISPTAVCEVDALGEGVREFSRGDLVFPLLYQACLECDMCRSGRLEACRSMPISPSTHNMMVGEQYESGLQEQIVLPVNRFRPISPGTPIEKAALIGYVSFGMQAVEAVDPQPWETVAITGAGPVGLSALQVCKTKGARVVICDVRADRVELALKMGADAAVDVSQDGVERMIKACGGRPSAIIDISGTAVNATRVKDHAVANEAEEATQLPFEIAARGARIALVGAIKTSLERNTIILKALNIKGVGGSILVDQAVKMVNDERVNFLPLITQRFPFSKLKEALDELKEAFGSKRADVSSGLAAIYVDESRLPTTSTTS